MKILIVAITADTLMDECLKSIEASGHPWHVSVQKPAHHDENPLIRTYKNCSENREIARNDVLRNSDASAFLFMDSDIVLPPGAVEEFIKQSATGKPIIGGWYPIRNDPNQQWVAGRWVADNVFHNFTAVQPSLVRTDMVGLGCALITREALENLHFAHGCDQWAVSNLTGKPILLGECGVFGNLATEKGYDLWMDGSVVCRHLRR